jgi:hypothetical protein
LFLVIALLIIAGVVFAIKWERPNFNISIYNGEITNHSGDLSQAILDDFANAVKDVSKASVRGYQSSDGIRLAFKGDIHASTQQRLRNIAGIHKR